MTDFVGQIAKLGQRAVALKDQLSGIKGKRSALAPLALAQDKSALTKLAALDDETTRLRRETELTALAIDEVNRLQTAAEQEAARQRRADIEQAILQEAGIIMSSDKDIDATLIRLRELFERRKRAATALAGLRAVSGHLTNRLHQRFGPTAAAMHAGLRSYLSFETVPLAHVRPLSESDAWLRRPLELAAPEPESNTDEIETSPPKRENGNDRYG
jgi:hypothetical protein